MKIIHNISQIIIKLLIKSSIELNFSKEKIHIIVIDKSHNINKARSIGLNSERNRRKLQKFDKIQINNFNYFRIVNVNSNKIKSSNHLLRNTNTPNQLTNYQIICIK